MSHGKDSKFKNRPPDNQETWYELWDMSRQYYPEYLGKYLRLENLYKQIETWKGKGSREEYRNHIDKYYRVYKKTITREQVI